MLVRGTPTRMRSIAPCADKKNTCSRSYNVITFSVLCWHLSSTLTVFISFRLTVVSLSPLMPLLTATKIQQWLELPSFSHSNKTRYQKSMWTKIYGALEHLPVGCLTNTVTAISHLNVFRRTTPSVTYLTFDDAAGIPIYVAGYPHHLRCTLARCMKYADRPLLGENFSDSHYSCFVVVMNNADLPNTCWHPRHELFSSTMYKSSNQRTAIIIVLA